jgi:hypothetical protein
MSGIEEKITETTSKSASAFKSIFLLDEDNKHELLNILQYALLAIIPIIALNKFIRNFVPIVDEKKGNFEILAEIIVQMVAMIGGIFFIHRIICFVPTYTATKYRDVNLLNVVLIFLMILFSLKSRLGDKVNILVDRAIDLWNGNSRLREGAQSNNNQGNVNGGNVRVTQPIVRPSHQPTSEDLYLSSQQTGHKSGTHEYQLPAQSGGVNFNSMYGGPTNHLVNANVPGQQRQSQGQSQGQGPAPEQMAGASEIFAANEGLGAFAAF